MFMQECRLTILVNGRGEVWGQVGYQPSSSLPMRKGRAGAERADCFATLVISAETYSGMFFIRAETAVQANYSHWFCSLRRVFGNLNAESPHHCRASCSFRFANYLDFCSQVSLCIKTSCLQKQTRKIPTKDCCCWLEFQSFDYSHKDFKEISLETWQRSLLGTSTHFPVCDRTHWSYNPLDGFENSFLKMSFNFIVLHISVIQFVLWRNRKKIPPIKTLKETSPPKLHEIQLLILGNTAYIPWEWIW